MPIEGPGFAIQHPPPENFTSGWGDDDDDDGGVSSGGGGGLSGAGSPEGVETADPGVTYLNTSNERLWVKKTGTGNTGWIEIPTTVGRGTVTTGIGAPAGIPDEEASLYYDISTEFLYYWDFNSEEWKQLL